MNTKQLLEELEKSSIALCFDSYEINYKGYERVKCDKWKIGDDDKIYNDMDIVFPKAQEKWTINEFVILDKDGLVLRAGNINMPNDTSIEKNDQVSFEKKAIWIK